MDSAATNKAKTTKLAKLARRTRIAAMVRGTEWVIQAYDHGWQLERAGEVLAYYPELRAAVRGLSERVSREVPDATALLGAALEFEATAERRIGRLMPVE